MGTPIFTPSRKGRRRNLRGIACLLTAICLLTAVGGAFAQEAAPPRLIRQPEPGRPVVIACVGDSLTEGTGSLKPEKESYPARLGRMLGKDYVVHNFGVGGATARQKTSRPYRGQAAFTESLACEPDAVIVMLGTNDTKREEWKNIDTFMLDYQELIAQYRELPSAPVVYIMTPTTLYEGWNSKKPWYGIRPEILDKILEGQLAFAEAEELPIIDAHTATAGNRDLVSSDGVHLYPSTNVLLAELVYTALTGEAPPTK